MWWETKNPSNPTTSNVIATHDIYNPRKRPGPRREKETVPQRHTVHTRHRNLHKPVDAAALWFLFLLGLRLPLKSCCLRLPRITRQLKMFLLQHRITFVCVLYPPGQFHSKISLPHKNITSFDLMTSGIMSLIISNMPANYVMVHAHLSVAKSALVGNAF